MMTNRFFTISLLVIGLILSCFTYVVNPQEVEIPKPFLIEYATPENNNTYFMGNYGEQIVNWQWIENHTTYKLTRDGNIVTNLLNINFSYVFTNRKYSYSFTSDNRGYFELTLTFDSKATLSYTKDNVVYFNYSDGQLFYNYNDINNIQQIDKNFNLNNNVFTMKIGKTLNKNINVVYDPTFGYSNDAANVDVVSSGNTEYLRACGALPTYGGWATSITIKTGSTLAATCDLHCALYYYFNNTLLAQTETKSVSATSTVYTFNFTSTVVMPYTMYYIAVAPANDYSDAKQKTIRRGSTAIQYYASGVNTPNFPDPIPSLSQTSNAAPYIYCTYTTNTRQTVTFNNKLYSINVDYENPNISFDITDIEGDNLTVQQIIEDFYTGIDLYTGEYEDTYNATIYLNSSWLEGNRFYRLMVINTDTFYPTQYTNNFLFVTRPNITMYENIINVTGAYEKSYSNITGFYIWANYTGNSTGCNLTGYWYYNYSDANITINETINKVNGSVNMTYGISDLNWLFLGATLLMDNSQLILILLISCWLFFTAEFLKTKEIAIAWVQFAFAMPLTFLIADLMVNVNTGYIVACIIPLLSIVFLAIAYFRK